MGDLSFNLAATGLGFGGALSGTKKGLSTFGASYTNEILKGSFKMPDWIASILKSGDQQQYGSYKVKSDDSLWGIAHDHGISVDSLLKINPKLEPFVDKRGHRNANIHKGDTLNVPHKK